MDYVKRVESSLEASSKIYAERESAGAFAAHHQYTAFLDPHDLKSIAVANVVYLVVVFAIMRVVSKTGPVSDAIMKPFMFVYNISCIVLAAIVVWGILAYKWTNPGSFACNQPDLSSPEGASLTGFIWIYYAQKYWEFLDTIIFALRGSDRQITFLHLYHHVSITVVTGIFLRHDINGDCYLAALANSFIHVLMYGHYFLSALNVKTWWSRHLTTCQLIQFLTVFAQVVIMWNSGAACGYPDWTKALMMAYQLSMLLLFGLFFASKYGSKGAAKAKEK